MRSSPDPKRRKTFISCSFIPHNTETFITSYFCFEKVPKGAHHKRSTWSLSLSFRATVHLLLSFPFFLWLKSLLLWFAARFRTFRTECTSFYLTGRPHALERLVASIVRRCSARSVEWMTEPGECCCSLQILVEQKRACFTSWTCKSWLQWVSKGHHLVFVREKLDLLRKHSRENRDRGGISLQASRVVFNMWTLSPWRKQNLNCS